MNAAEERDTLQVVGLGLSVPGAPGPALLGSTEWSLVLAVSAANGAPVAGLHRDAFSIVAIVYRRGGTTIVPLAHATVDEPMEGVYSIHFDSGPIDRLMTARVPCVVDVRGEGTHGAMRGRTLVQLGV